MTRIDCPHAPPCGGCPLLGLDYATQLEHKRAKIRRALGYHGALSQAQLASPVGAEPVVGYRVRAKLVVAPGPRLGLYAEGGGHDVVDIPHCRVLAPVLAEVARVLRELMANPPPEAATALLPASRVRGGALRGLDLREVLSAEGDARAMLTLLLDPAAEIPPEAFRAAVRAIVARAPAVVSVARSTQAGRGPRLLGSAPELLWGETAVRDRLGPSARDPFVLASPGGFVQAHRAGAVRIRARVAQELERALGTLAGRSVLDVYAGSGAIGLSLAARGARVVLVESFAPAALEAASAARAQDLAVEARAGDAAELLFGMLRAGERPDAIVVNPPRRGMSCEPDTLGRDLADLARLGLGCVELVPYDMMPHTEEVETLAVLRAASPPAPTVLCQAAELWALDKPAHEPTVPSERGTWCLLTRVAAMPGLGAAVPVHRLDADTSGVCLLAPSAGSATRWAKALGEAESRKDYLALCRGITRPKGVVSRPASGNPPRTRYRRLEVVGGHSLVRARVEQGRPQDIRRHLASIGHPVLGDARHGHAPSNRHLAEKHGLDRPFLHCARVVVLDPTTQQRLEIESPLAGDLQLVLDHLRALPAGTAESGTG
jgi:23S rRNA (uracil1939-C5)-methyltransferase